MAPTYSFHFRHELLSDNWDLARGFLVGEFDFLYAALTSFSQVGSGGLAVAAHHTQHEPGGADAITNLSANILTSGTIPDARISAAIARIASPNFTGVPTAPTPATADNSTTLATTAFVKAQNYAVSGAPPTAHHTTHEPGGTDALVNAAWTNLANVFTLQQRVQKTIPEWQLWDTAQAANARLFRVASTGGLLYLQAMADDGTTNQANCTMDRSANFSINGYVTIQGAINGPSDLVAVAFNAANFSGTGSMTWTVASGNQVTFAYVIRKKIMTVFFQIINTTVGGTLNNSLQMTVPGGFLPSKTVVSAIFVRDNNAPQSGYCYVAFGSTQITIVKSNEAAWAASTGLTGVSGQITFEVQ